MVNGVFVIGILFCRCGRAAQFVWDFIIIIVLFVRHGCIVFAELIVNNGDNLGVKKCLRDLGEVLGI